MSVSFAVMKGGFKRSMLTCAVIPFTTEYYGIIFVAPLYKLIWSVILWLERSTHTVDPDEYMRTLRLLWMHEYFLLIMIRYGRRLHCLHVSTQLFHKVVFIDVVGSFNEHVGRQS